jgi:hypothetical protein
MTVKLASHFPGAVLTPRAKDEKGIYLGGPSV